MTAMGATGRNTYTIESVIARNVDKNGPEHPTLGKHWIWKGYKSPDGYGEVKVCGKTWKAHRYIYSQLIKHVPSYMHLHHKCKTPACVNPDHLEMSGYAHCGDHNRNKAYCPQGHEYNSLNTSVRIDKNGYMHRHCKICSANAVRRWKERHGV